MDLTDAYSVAAHIDGGADYPARWAASAAAFRAVAGGRLDLRYGPRPRQVFDLFVPGRAPRGVLVFVHGGYWLGFDKSDWSHLAAGPLGQGWAVAIPSYDLCPDVRIGQITGQIAEALTAICDQLPGPLRLVGHSAGGHLVARMTDPRLQRPWVTRLERVVAISPLGDLQPLLQTEMNRDLGLNAAEALAESPIHQPAPDVPVTIWVGSDERPVFLDQARRLAQAWGCMLHVAEGRHHFDVLDPLTDPDSDLVARIVGPV